MTSAAPQSTRAAHGQMWRLAGPIILANSSAPLLGAVDTAVIGHLPDPVHLAAIAIGALVFSFLYWGLGFLRMGTTGLAAQAYGAWRRDGNAGALGAVFSRAALLGVILALAAILLQWPIRVLALPLFGAEPAVEAIAGEYFSIRIWGAPAALVNFVVLGWLLGTHKATTALVIQVALNLLNAILDVLFVVGFGWGVTGVAVGTLISEYAAALLGVALVARHMARDFEIRMRPLFAVSVVLNVPALRRLVVVNTDIFIRTACLLAAFGVFTATGAHFGTATLAANAVLMNFLLFMSHGLDGFAFAAEAMVGAEKGARDETAFRRSVRVTTIWAGLAAALYALVYAAAGPWIIHILTGITDVREIALAHLPWVIALPVLSVWSFQLDGIFVGLTRTSDMRNTMIVSLGLFLVALALMREPLGNHGLWAAFSLLMVARAITLGWYYRRIGDEFGSRDAH